MTRTTVVTRTRDAADGLASLDGVHNLRMEGESVVIEVDGDRVGPVMEALAGLGILSVVAHPPTLEQLLMRHYGEELAANGAGESR